MKKLILSIGVLFMSVIPFFPQTFTEATGAFEFSVLDIDSSSPVSMAFLNTSITNESPRVVVGDDGHLYVGGERLRIFGTNLSAFPEKNLAEANAKNLADRGYNCIRFHHTDADWTRCFIKTSNNGKHVIDTAGLDKFDYFIYWLKQYGIYANVNFLTGRTYTERDGMPKGSDRISDWKNRHLIGFWNEQARDLQKDYAREILNHVNPYTGIALKDDPVLAIVEINNEQGMIQAYLCNNFSDCPENLWGELEVKYNEWLTKNGYSYESLSKKINRSVPKGKVLVDKNSKWNLEHHDVSQANVTKNGDVHTINISKNGTQSWHVQYNTAGLKLEEGKTYTVSFESKANKPCSVGVSLMMAHDPWSGNGWNTRLNLTDKYRKFEFNPSDLIPDENARLNFGEMGFLAGTKIDIKNVLIYEGGDVIYVEKSQNPNIKNGVKLPRTDEYFQLSSEYKNIVINFLYDIEVDYWTDMRDYIRNDLKCPALQMGTSMGCTTTGLSMLFDIIDSHSYFNHPVFPGNGWDSNNYYVNNADLTREDFSRTLTNLAKFRVYGKPFSVSEYDHPYPNQFSAEMYPMYASFACFQDWDCIYTFCSEVISSNQSSNKKIGGYFDQTRNPVKAAAAPVAAKIFRSGLLPASEKIVSLELDEKTERDNLHKFGGWSVGNPDVFGTNAYTAMVARVGIEWDGASGNKIASGDSFASGKSIGGLADESGNLIENAGSYHLVEVVSKKRDEVKSKGEIIKVCDDGVVYVNEGSGTYVSSGKNGYVFVGNKKSKIPGDLGASVSSNGESVSETSGLSFTPSDDFASFMAAKLDDGSYLIFAASWSGNKNEKLSKYGEKPIDSKPKVCRDNISLTTGSGNGTSPALTLSVNGKLTTTEKRTLYKLDNQGKIIEKSKQSGKEFKFTQDSGTLWYLLTLAD